MPRTCAMAVPAWENIVGLGVLVLDPRLGVLPPTGAGAGFRTRLGVKRIPSSGGSQNPFSLMGRLGVCSPLVLIPRSFRRSIFPPTIISDASRHRWG